MNGVKMKKVAMCLATLSVLPTIMSGTYSGRNLVQAAEENAMAVAGRNTGTGYYESVPVRITNLLSEGTPAEVAAELAAGQVYMESFYGVSGRNSGPELKTYYPYGKDGTETITGLACAIYIAAGGCSEETMRMFADVIMNRVDDNRFPDTVIEVITQPGQFGLDGGILWPERASDKCESENINRCYQVALNALKGGHGELYGKRYIWASSEAQGHSRIWREGLCFAQ